MIMRLKRMQILWTQCRRSVFPRRSAGGFGAMPVDFADGLQQWYDHLETFLVSFFFSSDKTARKTRDRRRVWSSRAHSLLPHGQRVPSLTCFSNEAHVCRPAVVGNLWHVTDGDLDRFTESLLTSWLGDKSKSLPVFILSQSYIAASSFSIGKLLTLAKEMFAVARKSCKLPHLVGAAPVFYGLPVYQQQQPTQPTKSKSKK